MAGKHFEMLRALFRPWYIKAGSALTAVFAFIGIYAAVQDQFPDALPKLQEVVIVAHFLLLPWWGWLLVLQAVLTVGLYEYVRRTLPPRSICEPPQQELSGGFVAHIAELRNLIGREAQTREASINDLAQRIHKIADPSSSGFPVDPILERDLKGLLDIAAHIADHAFLEEVLRQAPRSIDLEWSEEAEDKITEFVSLVEARLIGTQYGNVYKNIMTNAASETDGRLAQKQSGYDCPKDRDPYQFRAWAIMRLQAEWFKSWLIETIAARELHIRSLRQELLDWHTQRVHKNGPHRN